MEFYFNLNDFYAPCRRIPIYLYSQFVIICGFPRNKND
nr:MAG TPA: hypothetical protein [Caudoviricetes sp.]